MHVPQAQICALCNPIRDKDLHNAQDMKRDAYDRLRDLMHHSRCSQGDLAKVLAIDASVVSRGIRTHRGFDSHWPTLAQFFNVSLDWLVMGKESESQVKEVYTTYTTEVPKPMPIAIRDQGTVYVEPPKRNGRDDERPLFVEGQNQLPLVGTVAAGSELISYVKQPRAFNWKPSWAIMRVEGTSAYPVVYPNQFVIVDTDRPVRHNNLVVVETEETLPDGTKAMNAYLKRYCEDPRAPEGFTLASVNAGIDSPYIPRALILVMVPVVGVLFEEGHL